MRHIGNLAPGHPEHIPQFVQMVQLLSDVLQRVILVVFIHDFLLFLVAGLADWPGYFSHSGCLLLPVY